MEVGNNNSTTRKYYVPTTRMLNTLCGF